MTSDPPSEPDSAGYDCYMIVDHHQPCCEGCLTPYATVGVQGLPRRFRNLASGALQCQHEANPQLESNLPLSKLMLQ